MLSKQSLLKRRLEMCNVRTRPVVGHLWCLSKSIWRFGIWQSDLMLKPKFVTCHYQRCKRADRQDCRAGAQKMMNWQGHILASSYLELAFSEWIPNVFIFFYQSCAFYSWNVFLCLWPFKIRLIFPEKNAIFWRKEVTFFMHQMYVMICPKHITACN